MRPNAFATQEVMAEGHEDVEQILGFKVSTITCPTLGKPNHRLKSDFLMGYYFVLREEYPKPLPLGISSNSERPFDKNACFCLQKYLMVSLGYLRFNM